MDALVAYAAECRAAFGVAVTDFRHQEMRSLPAMRQQRLVAGMEAVGRSVDKLRHSFTIFGMLDSRADPASKDGAAMCRDLLADMKKFGEFGGVLAANCSSLCLRGFVLSAFRSVFVAAAGLFARAVEQQKAGKPAEVLSPGVVWDALDSLRTLPKTDKTAFRRLMLQVYGVVKDTADEFKAAAGDSAGGGGEDDRADGGGSGGGGGGAEEPGLPAGAPATDGTENAAAATAPAVAAAAVAAATGFGVGDEVECQFEAELGGFEWFPGKIETLGAAPNTFNILYDDGDREPNVKARFVRRRGSGPPAGDSGGGGGEGVASMAGLNALLASMMDNVDDEYTPRDAAVVQDAVLLLRSVQKLLKALADAVGKVPKALPDDVTKALDRVEGAVRHCEKATTELGFTLYAPLKQAEVRTNVAELSAHVANLVAAAEAPALASVVDDYALHVVADLHKKRAAKVLGGL